MKPTVKNFSRAVAVFCLLGLLPVAVLAVVLWKLPFKSGERYVVTKGYRGNLHVGQDEFALDFTDGGCRGWDQPILAVAAGKVVKTDTGHANGEHLSYGNQVLLEHEGSVLTRYAHLNRVLVAPGQIVTQGDVVGTMGNTGTVFGSACPEHGGLHLHFAMYEKSASGKLAAIKPEPMSGYTNFHTGERYLSDNEPMLSLDSGGEGRKAPLTGGSRAFGPNSVSYYFFPPTGTISTPPLQARPPAVAVGILTNPGQGSVPGAPMGNLILEPLGTELPAANALLPRGEAQLRAALAGAALPGPSASSAAVALALSVAVGALGYAVRPRGENFEIIKTVPRTVYETVTRLVETVVSVTKNIVEYVSRLVPKTYAVAKTIYEEVVVGKVKIVMVSAPPGPSAFTPTLPAFDRPPVPPNLFRSSHNGRYWMLTGGLSDFPEGGGGVAREIIDQERVERLFGKNNIPTREFGVGSSGWSARYGGGSSGGAMTLDAIWRQLPEVFSLGSAPASLEAYARGEAGTGHPLGWQFQPQLLYNPRDRTVYTVDHYYAAEFSSRLGWSAISWDTPRDQVSLAVYLSPEDWLNNRPAPEYSPLFPAAVPAPTPFQLYFQQQKTRGRSAEDILHNNPFLAADSPPGSGAPAVISFLLHSLPLRSGLSDAQTNSIHRLLETRAASKTPFNTTDARNFAFALGQSNWQQYVGKSPADALILNRPRQAALFIPTAR